jgi:hypothetical protein
LGVGRRRGRRRHGGAPPAPEPAPLTGPVALV